MLSLLQKPLKLLKEETGLGKKDPEDLVAEQNPS